jgi:hypothetical protein
MVDRDFPLGTADREFFVLALMRRDLVKPFQFPTPSQAYEITARL